MMDERQLTELCRAGDQRAWRMLYDRYAGRILALTVRYMGDRERGEDVMQELFVRLFRSFDRFEWRGEGSLWAWMRSTAIHLAIDQLRTEGRLQTFSLDEESSALAVDPEGDLPADIPTADLLKLVAELPDGYRTSINLYYIDGFSHREIAERLHILEKSSSSRLARARDLLAKRIREYKATI